MSTSFPTSNAATVEVPSIVAVHDQSKSVAWWTDYMALTKPRIMLMILLTVGVAMLAACRINGTVVPWLVWINTLIATGMIAGSASSALPSPMRSTRRHVSSSGVYCVPHMRPKLCVAP